MANDLNSLLARVAQKDAGLAKELRAKVRELSSRREFGLNFEKHAPEQVPLFGRPITVGDKVVFIPPRGETTVESDDTWIVQSFTGRGTSRVAHLRHSKQEDVTAEQLVDDLVFAADFRDPIYPGLVSTGKVERGGDKPFHAVINSENFHALEAMMFTHQGKVDAIYIDPPYNTGAKDWKYNNDYVDGEDIYRHSKWLSFMERRLKMAKKLLNPATSVLIVTIDEKEYLRLGMLLEQTFPGARIQMVSSVINPASSARRGEFGRSNEYVYIVFFGTAAPSALELDPSWFGKTSGKRKNKIRWQELSRRGDNGRRAARPNLFYPLFVQEDGSRIHSVGEAIPLDADLADVQTPSGTVAVWPIRSDGSHGTWGRNPASLREALGNGFVRIGGFTPRGMAVYHLARGEQQKVLTGVYKVVGHAADGSVLVDDGAYKTALVPGTQWDIPAHDASTHGSALLARFLPGRRFPFPKSLYAVEDALRFFVAEKRDALIVDFFSGSGTTAHAVMRLNKQDGGRRRSISVTNNEVGVDEQKALIKKNFRPGDAEWEALGICDYITKPRIKAAITGKTPDGEPIKGDYKFTDEFPMAEGFEENVEFFTLTYENPTVISLDLAFERIAPLLWMRAGSEGRRIDEHNGTFDIADTYGVLFNVDHAADFLKAVEKADGLRMVNIVTDDEKQFQMIATSLPAHIEKVRLYESYLRTFEINTGKE